MSYKFTSSAERVLEIANDIALELGHNYVGTEHILVGLLKEGTGVAARVLEENNVSLNQILEMIKELIAFDRDTVVKEREGYSPRARKVLEEAAKKKKK